jgi:nitrogen regulatory protein PII
VKLVMLITAQVENGLEIAQSWQEAGAPGVTILRAHGLHALQTELKSGSVELPLMVTSMGTAMAAILESLEELNQIILSVVEDETVDKLITAANGVLGDLTEPNTGILFVLPLDRVVGLRDHRK